MTPQVPLAAVKDMSLMSEEEAVARLMAAFTVPVKGKSAQAHMAELQRSTRHKGELVLMRKDRAEQLVLDSLLANCSYVETEE